MKITLSDFVFFCFIIVGGICITSLVIALTLDVSHHQYYLGYKKSEYLFFGIFSGFGLIGLIALYGFISEWKDVEQRKEIS